LPSGWFRASGRGSPEDFELLRLGPLVRGCFGPYERTITESYRRIFVDLDDLARQIVAWVPEPRNILEVGCGEGALTERLASAFTDRAVTAIDVTPQVGRLFAGDRARVKFRCQHAEDLAEAEPSSFDLVVLSDVLHHVPAAERRKLLSAVRRLLAPDGTLAFKDWCPSTTPIHWMCASSDRYITGDDVRYSTVEDWRNLLFDVFGPDSIRSEARIRPWSNNFAFRICPQD